MLVAKFLFFFGQRDPRKWNKITEKVQHESCLIVHIKRIELRKKRAAVGGRD